MRLNCVPDQQSIHLLYVYDATSFLAESMYDCALSRTCFSFKLFCKLRDFSNVFNVSV